MKKIYSLLFIAVTSLTATAQNFQGGMETWRNYSVGLPPTALEAPAGWVGSDSLICSFGIVLGSVSKQVYKSTDKHSGTYAAMIMTKTQGSLGSFSGALTNTTINLDLTDTSISFSGGTAVTTRLGYVNAWVKYLPKGTDSASILVLAVIKGAGAGGADSVVGTGYLSIGATSTYTQVNVPIMYDDTTSSGAIPNALQVMFSSSDANGVTDSTMLFVDDVTAGNFPSGISIPLFVDEEVQCYPNPTTGIINLSSKLNETLNWQAVNMNGQVVANKTFNGNAKADVSHLSSGVYFYNITNREGDVIQHGKFSVAK